MSKSVAILGFAPASMLDVHDSQADEIWMMNHAYSVDGVPLKPDGTLRCSRLFEIHKENWFRRTGIPEYAEYWEWLQEPHDFQVVMQEPDPRVPNSWRYPFEAVCEDIFGHLWRKKGAEYIREKYFSASFDTMMALAIHEGYTRIEPYGIEMASDTEWAYQKPGGSFFIGLANGRGIDVMLPEDCGLCRAKIYGFEAVPAVSRAEIQPYLDYYEQIIPTHFAAYQEAAGNYNTEQSQENLNAMRNAMGVYNTHLGAIQMTQRIQEFCKDFVSRQHLEELSNMMRTNLDKAKAKTNVLIGDYRNSDVDDSERQVMFNEIWSASAAMYSNSGSLQLASKMVDECDMVLFNPVLTVDLVVLEKIEDDLPPSEKE